MFRTEFGSKFLLTIFPGDTVLLVQNNPKLLEEHPYYCY